MRQAAHAVGLVLADPLELVGRDEHQRVVGRLHRLGKAGRVPFARVLQVALGDIEALAAGHPDVEQELVIADRLLGHCDLALAAMLEVLQERVTHRRRIEAGRAEAVEQDVAVVERGQLGLPVGRDRAFLGQQRASPELEGDLAELGVVDPVVPLVEPPHAAGHDDRHAVGNTALAHCLA